MLKSLFGDLGVPEDPIARATSALEPDRRFAARAMMESVATEVNERGQMIDRHQRDLVVSGSPAQAMRDHFAATRTDAEPGARLITLFDPSRIWASAVVKALSDAGGMPIEKLHLRDQVTLGTLAMIERTTVVRRFDDALKVYHADVRAPGRDNTEIPIALMERSSLTAVVIGSMQPHAIDDMLVSLQLASSDSAWRCPALLFMLPPNAVWIANKIAGISWPEALQVQVQNESLTSASSVWNSVLGAWDRVKHLSRIGAAAPEPEPEEAEFPIKVADLELPEGRIVRPARSSRQGFARTEWFGDSPRFADSRSSMLASDDEENEEKVPTGTVLYGDADDPWLHATVNLDPLRARQALTRLIATEGVIACALVEGPSGLAIAQEARGEAAFDLDTAIAANAEVLRSHRLAARAAGVTDPIDEVIVTTGAIQQITHRVVRHQDLYLFMMVDKNLINLALARLKIIETEKSFV